MAGFNKHNLAIMSEATSDDTLLNNVLHRTLVPYDKTDDGVVHMCRLFSPYQLPQEAVNLEDWSLIDNVPRPSNAHEAAPAGDVFEYRDQHVRTDIVMVEPGTAAILGLAVFQWDVDNKTGRIRGLRLQPRTQHETAFLQSLPKLK